MSDFDRKMFGGYLKETTTNLYTALPGKRAVLKSLNICNTSVTDQRFYLNVGNTYICWLRTIKAGETLLIPVMDYVLDAGESIAMSVTDGAANTVMARLSGYDTDRMDLLTARGETQAVERGILSSSGRMMIKSIIICSRDAGTVNVNIRLGNDYILYNKAIKSLDTIYIPDVDQLLDPNESFAIGAPRNIHVHVNAVRVP